VLAGLGVGCGWLPPDSPAVKPAPPDPDAGLVHDWKITGYILGPRALLSEADAAGFHDRVVAITSKGYNSPWSGSCNDSRREKRPRALAEVADDHGVARDRAASLGLAEPILEYQLLCVAARTPALLIDVAGPRALTCWSGVCYLLAR